MRGSRLNPFSQSESALAKGIACKIGMTFEIRNRARALQREKSYIFVLALFLQIILIIIYNTVSPVIQALSPSKTTIALAMKIIVPAVVLLVVPSIYCALKCSIYSFCLSKARNENVALSGIFSFFCLRSFFKALLFSGLNYLLNALFFGLCFLPTAAFAALFVVWLNSGCTVQIFQIFVVSLIAFIAISAFFYFKIRRLLFLAPYLFVDGRKRRLFDCFCASAEIMSSQTKRLFMLRAGFIGWFLLCVFVIPIPFVISYYAQTMAVFACELMKAD